MKKKLVIGFTYDAKEDYKLKEGEHEEIVAEFDDEETIEEIENALKTAGHEIKRIGHVRNLIQKINEGEKWDIVFNIAEGIKGRNRESQVPLLLEMHGIPYTGSDALTMGVTLDKAVAKKVVSYHGVRTPSFIEIEEIKELESFNLQYPVIVKPSEEGTSKGITKDSVARDKEQLEKQVQFVLDRYKQPVIIEEFIVGQEFTVVVMGNKTPKAFPPVQIAILEKTDLGEDFYTAERVDNSDIKYICPSEAPQDVQKKMMRMAEDAYTAVGCKDFGRVDFRVDYNGNPYFLELNPLPNISTGDVFPLVAEATGKTYEKIISEIVHNARERYKI